MLGLNQISLTGLRGGSRFGPNVIVNGDFSNGSTGWTLTDATVTGEKLVVTSGAYFAAQGSVLTVGKTYEISFDAKRTAGANLRFNMGNLYIWSSSELPLNTTVQLNTILTAASTGISIEADALVFSGEIDNLIVREIL